MKNMFLILALLIFSNFAQAKFTMTYDSAGFPVCVSEENQTGVKTYFFNWDRFTRTDVQTVFYFDKESYIGATGHSVQGCKDLQYMKDIPVEILIPLNSDAGLFPDSIHFALNQVGQGGHKFHAEKSPQEFIEKRSNQFKFNSPEVLTQLKHDAGKFWAQQVVSAWTAKSFDTKKNCQNYFGSCDFYLCQEKKNPCGIDGYNLSFGYKYCSGSRFSLFKTMQTPNGKKWVADVISCLHKKSFSISKLLNQKKSKQMQCEQINSASFDSHANCYVESGFCELPLTEKLQIAALIKGDIFTRNAFSEATNILRLCEEKQ